jgi:flagellar hook-associated protein 1 FlgK
MANILSIAKTGLAAAQAGLATTGHNITNAATPGYNRQMVLQSSVPGQNEGSGFVGKGTTVAGIRRVYNEHLNGQIRTSQTTKGQLETHHTEISRINNLLADPTSGLSPVLQDFFKSVQDVAANKGSGPSRYAVLASSESLAGRFQSMAGQMSQIRDGVNRQIETTVGTINSYAQQIANLNEAIGKAQSAADGQPPNDLLDQRDHLISEMSKQTKVSVVKEGYSMSVFIANGQPMVVGESAFKLEAIQSVYDPTSLDIGLVTRGGTTRLGESGLYSGKLGGLLEFRSTSLTEAQNSLGRIALGLAATFNDQHRLGKDQNGAMGEDVFKMSSPRVQTSSANTGTSGVVSSIADVSELTLSDYRVDFDGTDYRITRLADKQVMYTGTSLPTQPAALEIDGVNFAQTGGTAPTTMAAGDSFIVKPTVEGASDFRVLLTDKAKIATAAPISTEIDVGNIGSGVISAGKVDSDYVNPPSVALPVTLTYDAAAKSLSGIPTPFTVTINGASPKPVPPATAWAAGDPFLYEEGKTISFDGISVEISGKPGQGDTFTVKNNTNPGGDNRNILLLGALQGANTLDADSAGNPTASYQGAFGQFVSLIGNKTHELEVTKSAEGNLLTAVVQAQQSESGVNLDEEAANLLRYQQAYQASGKVMQAVSEMFDVLMSMR